MKLYLYKTANKLKARASDPDFVDLGNLGPIPEDTETEIVKPRALVVENICEQLREPELMQHGAKLISYLKENPVQVRSLNMARATNMH